MYSKKSSPSYNLYTKLFMTKISYLLFRQNLERQYNNLPRNVDQQMIKKFITEMNIKFKQGVAPYLDNKHITGGNFFKVLLMNCVQI